MREVAWRGHDHHPADPIASPALPDFGLLSIDRGFFDAAGQLTVGAN